MALSGLVRGASAKSVSFGLRNILAIYVLLLGSLPEVFAQLQSLTPVTTLETSVISLSLSPSALPPDSTVTSGSPGTITTTTTSTSTATTTSALTTIISIYYLNIRGDEERGLPYTMFHQDTGSIIDVDESATTYVVTGTMTDLRTGAKATEESSTTTKTPKFSFSMTKPLNATGQPSTITQGPSTFEYTGTNYGQERTLINRCKLEGLTSATCDLTHVGKGWYTRKHPDFSGTWSTYNYTWTSGDRFGFAPVTITAGVEKLSEARQTQSDEEDAGGVPTVVMLEQSYWLACTAATLLGSFILGIFAVV